MEEKVEETGIVYALYDPRDPEKRPRYVGQTQVGIHKRLQRHIQSRFCGEFPVRKWICGLLEEGITPAIGVLENVSVEVINETEAQYISRYRDEFEDILNVRPGGGFPRGEDSRERRRQASLGRKHSAETIEKLKNIRNSPRIVELHRIANVAFVEKLNSPEFCERISSINRGRKHSNAELERMKNAWTPERREKSTKSMTNTWKTVGRREKSKEYWTLERREEQARKTRLMNDKRRAAKLAALSCENVDTEAHARAQGE